MAVRKVKADTMKSADDIRVGDVVRSVSGRDRKRVCIVISKDEGDKTAPIVIADGVLRKVADCKHKNPLHLRFVGTLTVPEVIEIKCHPTDSRIAALCERFDKDEKLSGKW